MRIKNRTVSIVYKLVLSVVGLVALASQLGVFEGSLDPSFWHYFTHLSNLLVILYFIADCIYLASHRSDPEAVTLAPRFKYACMMAITVTWLVAHFLLNGGMVFRDGVFNPCMLVVHYIVPIGMVLDWLLFDKKGTMGKADPLVWVVLPLVYLAYVFIMVYGVGVSMAGVNDASRFPYPFIDVDAQGVPVTVITVIVMVVFFIVLGYIYRGIDHLLARGNKSRKTPKHARIG